MTQDIITRITKANEQQALALHLIEERMRQIGTQLERIADSLQIATGVKK